MTEDLDLSTAPSDATFDLVRNLITVLAHRPKSTRLLNELGRKIADAKAAEAKLAAERDAFEQASSKTRAELDERAARLRLKEISIYDREARLAADQQIVEQMKATLRERHRDPNLFGTITREPEAA
jgi:hypothetical protein